MSISRPYKQQYGYQYAYATAPPPATFVGTGTPLLLPRAPNLGFFESTFMNVIKPAEGTTANLQKATLGESKAQPIEEGIRAVLREIDRVLPINDFVKRVDEASAGSRRALGEEWFDRLFNFVPAPVYAQFTGRSEAQIQAARKALAQADLQRKVIVASTSPRNTPKPGQTPVICPVCKVGTTRASTGCGCRACSACRAGYKRGSVGCSCVAIPGACKCTFPGCSGTTGSTCDYCCRQRKTYYINRCKGLCKTYNGYAVSSNGGCSCRGGKKVTRCPYSGCTGLNAGSTCFRCRCAKICGSRGIKSVSSNGSCYCKPKPTSSTSGGCSQSLRLRCGNICIQKYPNRRPVLDSQCSCHCK